MAEPTTPTVLPHLLVIEDDYRDLALFMAEEPRSAEDIEQYRAENMRMRLWCPGVTDHCRMWLACDDKDHEHPDRDSDEWDEGEATIGGIEHRVIAYDWMTRTESCLVVAEGFEGGDAWDLANEVGYIPGVYPVEHDWDDAIYLSLDASGADIEPLIEAALAIAPLDPCLRCNSNEIAEAHDPCCSSHNRPMCHRCYSRTHFVETGCCGPQYAVIRPKKEATHGRG